jgi:outer membrane protein assembly factor BamB
MSPDPRYVAKVAETVRLSVGETDDPREFRQYLLELHDVLYDADIEGELYEELLTALEEHTERLQKDHPLGAIDDGRRTRILDDVYRVEQFCQRTFSGDDRAAPGVDDPRVTDTDADESPQPSPGTDTDAGDAVGGSDTGCGPGAGSETVDGGPVDRPQESRGPSQGAADDESADLHPDDPRTPTDEGPAGGRLTDGEPTDGGLTEEPPTNEEPAGGASGDQNATTAVMSERLFSAGSVVRAGPFLRDGTLYIGCQSGRVHAVAADTGARKWYYDGDGIASQLAVGAGAVYLGGDQRVTAIDRYSGRERWTQHDHSITGTATPARGESRVFAATRAVRALRTGTGDIEWVHELGAPAWALDSDLMHVYVGTNDGEVRAVDVGFGNEEWSYRVGDTVERIVTYSGTVYVRTGAGVLYALDRSSGYVEWQMSGEGLGGVGPVVTAGDISVCLGGEFYSLQTGDGEVWWRYDSEGPFSLSPRALAVDGTAYVGAHDGTVHALDGWGKTVEWRTTVDHGGEGIRGIAAHEDDPVVAAGTDLVRLSPGTVHW